MAGDFEKDFEAQLEVFSKIDVFQKEKEEMMKLRRVNMPVPVQIPRKEHEANKKQLKSDLKKSNTYVKKLRAINAEGIMQCVRETETLNLNLFISEIVGGILAIGFKATDVGSMVKLCACLHQRYEEFTEPLVTGLKMALMNPPAEDDNEAGKRKRIQIRFLIELYQAGIFLEEDFFCVLLRSLVGKPKGATTRQPMDIHALGTFAKYGSEVLMGYMPRKLIELAQKAEKPVSEMPLRLLTSMKACNEMRAQITDTFQQLSGDLVKYHKEYRSREAKSEKDKLIHGAITEQKQLELDQSKRIFERLLSIVTTLSESTGDEIPVLEIEKEEEDGARGLTVWEGIAGVPEEVGGGLYGDAESRAFYEDLPDLLTLVPLTILGFTPEQAAAMREEWAAKKEGATAGAEDAQQQEKESDEVVAEDEEDFAVEVSESETAPSDTTTASGVDANSSITAEEGGADESRQSKLNTLLAEKLPDSLNKQKADDFCTAFCFLNSKGARKKLAAAMLKLPRNRSELAPTYARIVASLARLYPEITEPILEALRKEFHGMVRARNQLYVENKIKNVRYQAELVKFGVAPPIVALRMFKSLLADFTQHNVELLAVLLETCGRFLYLMPHTNPRMNEILDTMLRLRRAKNLDLRQQTLLESAYFAVKPPERVHRVTKQYSVVQQYARYLIQERADDPKASVDEVIKSLRRLPWGSAEENISLHVVKAVLKVARTKYVSLPNVADCLSGLARYYPNLVTQLVDRVLEELQRALDSPYKREIQRSLGLVRLLGELYNFTAVSSTIVFDLLYHLLNFGHSEVLAASVGGASLSAADLKAKVRYDPRIPADVDPPSDLFRAQLVCEMLNTCGLYYVRGQAKDRLSKYLMYFQRYLLTKQHVPLHVEFSILDALDSLEELAREAVAQTQKKGRQATTAPVGAMFPRYDNMEAVQAVIEAYELTHLAGDDEEEEDENVRDSGDKGAANENEGEEEAAIDEDGSGSDSEGDEESDSEDEDDDEEEEPEEEEEDGLSESEAAAMLEKLRIAEEDDDFEKAFRDVMTASVSAASNVKFNDVNRMAIPASLPKPKNAFRPSVNMDEQAGDDEQAAERQDGKTGRVAFKLLSRDTKGRFETRQLLVPEHNPMAVKLVRAEEEQRQEKRRIKEQILQLESLSEIAEFEGGGEVSSSGVFGLRDSYQKPVSAVSASGRGGGGRGGAYLNPNYITSGRAGGGRYGGLSTFTRGNGQGVKLVRAEETRKPADSLNLDQFLAESSASDLRQNYPLPKRK